MAPPASANFKVRARSFLLTYSALGTDDTAARIIDELPERLTAIFQDAELVYKAWGEEHEDGQLHVHAFVIRSENKQVKVGARLDLEGHHPNVKPFAWNRESTKHGWEYDAKDGKPESAIEFTTNLSDEVTFEDLLDRLFGAGVGVANDKKAAEIAYSDAMGCSNYDDAMRVIQDRCPRDYVLEHNKISNFFKGYFTSAFQSPYHAGDFNTPLLDFDSIEKRQSFVLVGPPGMGKTFFALAHFERPLFVNHLDDLAKFSETTHDGIVFDEISVSHWPAGSVKSLLDRELPRAIHIRYKVAHIPAGTKKIFCCNSLNDLVPEKCTNMDDLDAIESRKSIVQVTGRLF